MPCLRLRSRGTNGPPLHCRQFWVAVAAAAGTRLSESFGERLALVPSPAWRCYDRCSKRAAPLASILVLVLSVASDCFHRVAKGGAHSSVTEQARGAVRWCVLS